MWPGYQMFIRKQCWHLVSEWTLGLMNALKYYWCETSLLSQAVLKHVVSKDFNSSLCKGLVLYSAKNEEMYGIVPYQKIFRSCYITFKKENFNMWVTSGSYVGHIRIVLWVSGSSGSTGVTHFQPCFWLCCWDHNLLSLLHEGLLNSECPSGYVPL